MSNRIVVLAAPTTVRVLQERNLHLILLDPYLCPDRFAAGVTMLDELGRTPDEVADSLRVHGIKGVRNTARFLNPIVRYARTVTIDVYGIDLIQADRLRIVFANGEVTEVPVPLAVLKFLELFHRGQYPDLEMPIDPG